MLLHGVHLGLFLCFWGLVLILSVFGGWSCYRMLATREPKPGLLPRFVITTGGGVAILLSIVSNGGFSDPNLFVFIACLPFLLCGLALLLWCVLSRARRVQPKS